MTATHYHLLPAKAWAGKDNTHLKKVKFLKDHNLPGVDEIRMNIGNQLASIFFDQTSDTMRERLGIDKKLEGPKEQLWIAPEDQLMGKLVLTEPYPRQEVQAMTHQNILDIGEELENKFEQSKVEELSTAVQTRELQVREEMTKEMNDRIEAIKKYMESLYMKRLQHAKRQITQHFNEMMKERDKIVCKKADKKVLQSLSYLRKSMAEEMELMAKRREDYNDDVTRFQRTRDANEANEVFKKKVNNLKKHWMDILEKSKNKFESEKQELKKKLMDHHNSEMEKVQEACNEAFQLSLQSRTYNYRKTISDLLRSIRKKDEEYEKLKMEKECVHIEQYSWCYLVRELLKQFQKFINYALQERSGHTEYFLSLEKLLQNRINSLSEEGFLREYVDENGKHLIDKKLVAEDVKLRMLPLKKVKEEERTKPEYPCLPEDIFHTMVQKQKDLDRKEATKDIEIIIDKVIERAMPKRITELPCIDSELWSSAKSEPDNVGWPAEPKPPGILMVGEQNVCQEKPWQKFTEDRIKSVIKVLNKHPQIKLAVMGNGIFE